MSGHGRHCTADKVATGQNGFDPALINCDALERVENVCVCDSALFLLQLAALFNYLEFYWLGVTKIDIASDPHLSFLLGE